MCGSLVRLAWLGSALALSACEAGGGSLYGDVPADAATLDATLPRDQATSDVGPDADLGDASTDAGTADASRADGGSDAGSPIGVPCTVQGAPGTCQLVASCTQVTTPGYCPGPADVRCCHPPIPPSDAGMLTGGVLRRRRIW
ncbi:MAG: hypothetical protein R3B40_23535 [Polyangiales bacterium]|nr:hypothetical protein [Myxococcales bacterium]MCB9661009.1 hypothetical protein [Sandaracinaceae bacterium]